MTDDVLCELDTNWAELQTGLEKWIEDNCGRAKYEAQHKAAVDFRGDGWNRKDARLKALRNVIVMISGSTNSWEVAVGKAIARMSEGRFNSGHCLAEYLGPDLVEEFGLTTERRTSAAEKTER